MLFFIFLNLINSHLTKPNYLSNLFSQIQTINNFNQKIRNENPCHLISDLIDCSNYPEIYGFLDLNLTN